MMALVILPLERPLDLIGVDNGALDPDLLDPVGPRGLLHHLAARAWFALVASAASAGYNLTYTYGGTYRTLADQEWLFRSRYVVGGTQGGCKLWVGAMWCKKLVGGKVPASAAVPGTSNHGLGLAIDMALDMDPGDGISPDDAVNIGPALPWLAEHAPRFGFSWEGPANNIEPWHIRYVTGDHIPQAVIDHETPPRPTPIPLEDDDMSLILYRDRRFNNVFRVGDQAITIGLEVFANDTAKKVPYIEAVHDQSLIAYMRSSMLTMHEMVPSGEPNLPVFNPPADLT